jgi:hypothetical protein
LTHISPRPQWDDPTGPKSNNGKQEPVWVWTAGSRNGARSGGYVYHTWKDCWRKKKIVHLRLKTMHMAKTVLDARWCSVCKDNGPGFGSDATPVTRRSGDGARDSPEGPPSTHKVEG